MAVGADVHVAATLQRQRDLELWEKMRRRVSHVLIERCRCLVEVLGVILVFFLSVSRSSPYHVSLSVRSPITFTYICPII